jgi:VCBS repeat-containing protein
MSRLWTLVFVLAPLLQWSFVVFIHLGLTHCIISSSLGIFRLTNRPSIARSFVRSSAHSSNDSDPDGDELTICGLSDGGISFDPNESRQLSGGGNVTVDTDGCYTYSTGDDFESLKEGETVEVCFQYVVCDPAGGSDEAEVCILIEGANDPPVAEDNSYSATKDVLDDTPTITGDILDNDSDPDSDKLTIVEVTAPGGDRVTSFVDVLPLTKGNVTVDPDTGELVYTPDRAEVEALGGNESFVELLPYKISDGMGGTSEATVTITVFGDNDPPMAENDSETVPEGGEVSDCIL